MFYDVKYSRTVNNYGYYVFKDFPDLWTFLGLFIIISSGIYIFRRELKNN